MSDIRYTSGGLEGATVTKRGAHIVLRGLDYLVERKDPAFASSDNPKNLFEVIKTGQRFMYAIQQVDETFTVRKSEQGIARIVENEHQTDGGIFTPTERRLERITSLTGSFANFYSPGTYLRVATCSPGAVMDFISPGESVLVFRKDGHVDSVEIPQGSVLGREDGEIIPISYNQLMSHTPYERIFRLLSAMEDQLKLNTRRLDLTTTDATVSAPIFRLAPESYSDTSKPTPQQGMIIYNSDDKCLEFYDGKEWRTLVWQ